MSTNQIISKVWSFCNTLRDDGVGYGDYLEQLTYLLFLKMADEYTKPPYNRKLPIPAEYNWQSLTPLRGAELELHYINMLECPPGVFSPGLCVVAETPGFKSSICIHLMLWLENSRVSHRTKA